MTERDNLLRAVRFERPDTIPMVFHINAACWHHYPPESLEELMSQHPMLFPEFEPSSRRVELTSDRGARAHRSYVDPWGCTRDTTEDGIATLVTGPALASWDDWPHFRAPDPATSSGAARRRLTTAPAAFAGALRRLWAPPGASLRSFTAARGAAPAWERLAHGLATTPRRSVWRRPCR